MPARLRTRFWLESAIGSVTGAMAVVTLLWHDWIEAVFRIDPDRGNGSAEWLVVMVFAALTVLFAFSARHEWRRAQVVEP
jgi:hypothetical protein